MRVFAHGHRLREPVAHLPYLRPQVFQFDVNGELHREACTGVLFSRPNAERSEDDPPAPMRKRVKRSPELSDYTGMYPDQCWRQARKASPIRVALLVAAFLACGLGAFLIDDGKYQFDHNWSFSDPLCALLAMITVCALMRGTLMRSQGTRRFDGPTWWMLGYVGMYVLSMSLNGTWASGSPQNFLRTATFALMLYIMVRGILRSSRELSWFFCLAAVFGAIVSINGMAVLLSHTDGFTNQVLVLGDISNSMNQWGFLQVMCFAITVTWWARSPHAIYRALPCAVMVAGIALSFSRTAYSCLAITLLVMAISSARKITRTTFIVALAGATLWRVIDYVQEAMPDAMVFLSNKINTYQSDFNDTRLVDITANPFMEWSKQSLPVLLFGDGLTVAHNMFINCLWETGAFGLVLMIGYEIALFLSAVKLWHTERKLGSAASSLGAAFFTLILIMMLDDFATNFRNHVQIIAYTFAVFAGALSSPAARATVWSRSGAASWRRAVEDRMALWGDRETRSVEFPAVIIPRAAATRPAATRCAAQATAGDDDCRGPDVVR